MKHFEFPCRCRFPIIGDMDDGRPQLTVDLKFESIPLDCERTWDLISSGNTKGVFQLESRLGQSFAKKLKPRNIEHLSALIAIMRPGALESITEGKSATMHYIDRKNGEEEITYFHPSLEPILKKTYAVLIYQENSMQIAKDIAGFSLEDADILRKCVAYDSKLTTQYGDYTIEDLVREPTLNRLLKAGKLNILTRNDKGEIIWKKLKDVWFSGTQNTYRLTTQICNYTGQIYTIRATPNHKFYIANKGWVELQDVSLEDYIVCSVNEQENMLVKVVELKEEGLCRTYDYEVDDDNIHWAFVNNILAHNSIGKKDTELMAQTKTKFLEGCKNTNIVNEEEALEIFNWIEKSQRYQFNLCLGLNTVVETPSGLKTLSELQINDKVLAPSSNNTGKDEYVAVLNIIDNGMQEIYEIETETGETIQCTLNHKFLCKDNIKRPLYEILAQNLEIMVHVGTAKIIKIRRIGYKPTIDIEVDSPKHVFYGNGIVTSNSHSVAYAMNSYISAYMKAHFPRAFYTAYLYYAHEKTKPYEEINELINDARLNDIEVLPPSLLRRNTHFKLYDKNIYFGLTDIKGVGKTVYNKLSKAIDAAEKIIGKNLGDMSWLDLLLFVFPKATSTVVENLISVGALSHFNISRSRMLYEYKLFNELSKREQQWCVSHYLTCPSSSLQHLLQELIARPAGKTGGCANVNRLTKVTNLVKSMDNPPYSLNDRPEWIASLEESLLGVPLTCASVESCDISAANCTCKEFLQEKYLGKTALMAVQVDAVKEIKTKRGKNPGQKMAFITVSDITGMLDNVVVFPDDWPMAKRLLIEGNNVIISGERGKENSFVLKKVYQI